MLHHYWNDFDVPHGNYYLFVGKKIAVLGRENSAEATLTEAQISQCFDEVKDKLAKAGITIAPQLFVQFELNA